MAMMKRWWSDTLSKRLFALMWLALVVSHVVAFVVVTHQAGFDASMRPGLPTFPSLPPLPGPRTAEPPRPGPGDREGLPPPDQAGPHAPPGPAAFEGPPPRMGPGLPASAVLLDYGIRFVIIGLAAWLGARWLARPMRRLAQAAGALGPTLARGTAPPPALDEETGTVEVRETARVFNAMARQIRELVDARALLVAAISHDLRTPLTRIRMRLEAVPDDALVQRSIADIREMDALIESALEIFRGTGRTEPPVVTDVFALVQSLVDDLADLGQPVQARGASALARVHPPALRRVVANLVDNALRYGERAEVSVEERGDSIAIVVDDHGPGIPEAQLESVMQPFVRLERSRNRSTGGSGLGLYIARDLVTGQGGTLALANRPEGGLRATITLPRTPERAAA
jgi:protein-histidine pros-kinase